MIEKEVLEKVITEIRTKYIDTKLPSQKEEISLPSVRINISSQPFIKGNIINKTEAMTEIELTITVYANNFYKCLEMSKEIRDIMYKIGFERSNQTKPYEDSILGRFKQEEFYKATTTAIKL